MTENQWPMWEVFVRSSRGLSHVHAGSLHAPDATMALRNGRDLYTRRNEGSSVWVVPSEAISSTDPDSKGGFFESARARLTATLLTTTRVKGCRTYEWIRCCRFCHHPIFG